MPTFAGVSVDAEGALRFWLQSVATLVGPNQPVSLGFFLERQRSKNAGTYGQLGRLAGTDAFGVEASADMARMTCSIFSTTRQAAALGAVAYANTLRTLSTIKPALAEYDCVIRLADNISGPLWVPNPDKALPQYLVDADIYFEQLT
jgi:hypothetical protein